MRIAFVDGDAEFLAQAARTLALVLDERGTRAEVARFVSADALLAARKRGAFFDIYLLGATMPGMDGIALGRRIRADQPDAPIVIFSSSRDFALEAIGLEVADYVLKPFDRDALARAIGRAFRRLSAVCVPTLTLKAEDGYDNVPLRDIVTAEASGRYQVVQTAVGRSFVLQHSMMDLWKKLSGDSRFLRVGRQCIVNLAHVAAFRDGALVLDNGKEIAVPRRSLAEVKREFLGFFRA